MRVFAFSDLHVDHDVNRACIRALPARAWRDDVLLLAGDISDDLNLVGTTLASLRERFLRVFYVPGNHELWLRGDTPGNALERWWQVLEIARRLEVDTGPATLGSNGGALTIVPLYSWYRGAAEGAASLYLPKPGERRRLVRWGDDRHVHWPSDLDQHPADYFLALNEPHLRRYRNPVLTLSHFLPRTELMFSGGTGAGDAHPRFNFSRVAGCRLLDGQIRRLGSQVHVYGHQHRNRARDIDGVRYVSHCLGYPRERRGGYLDASAEQPRCIWPLTDAA